MTLHIGDGKGRGHRLAINYENRALVESVQRSSQFHYSLNDKAAYQALSGARTITTASTYGLLALKNTSNRWMAITYIRVGIDKTETNQAKVEILVGGTWNDGSAGSIVTCNLGSSLPAEATAHYNSIPTTPSVIDTRWLGAKEEVKYNKEGSIVIPTSGIIAIRITTETDAVTTHGRISFFYLPTKITDTV